MLKLLLFFLNLEGKVKKADSSGKSTAVKNSKDTNVERTYAALQKTVEPYRAEASRPSFGGRTKAAVKNIANIARTAFDSTVGNVIAKYQDYDTKRYFKKNPGSKDPLSYLVAGFGMPKGSQRVLAGQLKKAGIRSLHLKTYHHLPRKESSEKAFEQIKKFQEEVKLKEPYKRSDSISGHSSGADLGIYMAGDKRIVDYGIKYVQARAPVPYGVNKPTMAQRAILSLSKADDPRTALGKRNAAEMAIRKPLVPVHIIAGKYDALVPPRDTVYGHATTHKVIDHPSSTHFGTSGANKDMNEIFIKELVGYSTKDKYKYKKAA
ncbi:hypothetical protein HYU07_04795 [Candidatus Woesearchaeota archaeon]|nr:hypothetical protein [Candidatus Woesearchaeota archaeon]